MSARVTPSEASEYEGRLFGGAYGVGAERIAAKDSPKRKMIALARARYNEYRVSLGLAPVSDWTVRPAQLVQHLPAPAPGRTCVSCGEPEDGGQHGWFDAPDDGLRCMACGKPPLAKRPRQAGRGTPRS